MLRQRAATTLLATGLIAGALAFAAGPAAAAAPWVVTPSPSPFQPARIALSSVSCTSPKNCFAVGRHLDINEGEPGVVIERWNGTAWSTVVNTKSNGFLTGVSCAGPKSCFAVGSDGNARTLAKRWNGTQWKTIATPAIASSTLNGVDCATATNCVAVGSYRVGGSRPAVLIEQWNGTTWTKVPSPNLPGTVTSVLYGVSCLSAKSCFAVGNQEKPGDQVGGVLVEHYDGKSWSVMTAPNPGFVKYRGLPVTPQLAGVSCTSPKSCMAVGYATQSALIERFNGTKWSIVKSPQAARGSIVEWRSVSCAAANDCSAVGSKYATADAREGLPLRNSVSAHWNGSAWKVTPKPAPVPTNTAPFEVGQLAELNGVSCPAKAFCTAVGNSVVPERWNGSKWSLAPLADKTSSASGLADVACPAPTTCLAVGGAPPLLAAARNVLTQRWDGSQWSVVPSTTPTGTNVYAYLVSISCVSATDCTAVGAYDKQTSAGSRTRVLIERWNGTKWSTVASPSPAPAAKLTSSSLSAVSCTSATDCNAVGDYMAYSGTDLERHLLAEHWNGASWSIVPIPGPTTTTFTGLSCSSATNCFAVGSTDEGTPVLDRWTGTQWTAASVTTPPAGASFGLNDVTCVSDTDCTLVGTQFTNTNFTGLKTLIERWNGTSWSVVPSPNATGRKYPRLESVACASATSCVAVGTLDEHQTKKASAPFILEWDGAVWSIATAAAVAGATGVVLTGAASLGTGFAAVGTSSGAWGSRTLVEQRS